jgi:hypothetical protein
MRRMPRLAPPKPLSVYAYFDKIQFWVLRPLDHETLAWLRRQCGRGGLHADNRPARFDARYRQRIELRQPSEKALHWLAGCDDALINRAEITIDFVFKSLAERDDAWDFLHRHLVRRWHGKKQQVRIYRDSDDNVTGGTRYDASRRAPNSIAFYREDHSRITGEIACLHLEWRLNGLNAVQRAGIELGQDLLGFSHRQFWESRLRLLDVDDRRRIGRLIINQARGKRSRGNHIKQTGSISIDGRTGEAHLRSVDTIQELNDKLKGRVRIHRALVAISNKALLPK